MGVRKGGDRMIFRGVGWEMEVVMVFLSIVGGVEIFGKIVGFEMFDGY